MEVSATWCADLLLRANQLVGTGCEWSADQQRQCHSFNELLCSIAGGKNAQTIRDVRSAVFTMSLLRRDVAAMLKRANAPVYSTEPPVLTFAAFAWISSASDCPSRVSADTIKSTVDHGMACLRVALADMATIYMDVTTSERSRQLMSCLTSAATSRLVRSSLIMKVVSALFDSARLGAGLRLVNYALGDALASLGEDVSRAEQARTDAYMAMRLYKALEFVVAMAMMGAAKQAEHAGDRNEWSRTAGGRAILSFRF